MRLHEYQTKTIFRKYEIPTPRGKVATNAGEAKLLAEEIGGPVVVKAQVLVSGRGKAGGIRLAKSPKEAEELTSLILGREIKGFPVNKVLIEEAVIFTQEVYIAITLDREAGLPILITSGSGGIDIEEVALRSPEKILKQHLNPLLGIQDFHARLVAVNMDLPHPFWRQFAQILSETWKAFREHDAILVEINPLVLTSDNRMIALDGKMVIDDNALFRQVELAEYRWIEMENSIDTEARKFGLSYIPFSGTVGCMVNGAGLAMASMDLIKNFGGEPANFLDIGGGASAEKVGAALRIILSDVHVKSILINIFGGITRCDEVARGIVSAMHLIDTQVPIVVRLAGTNAKEGMQILASQNLVLAESLSEAARLAVGLSQRE
ncbi:MAG TPA: ADP-forming succinate--CoA ligase subunit beta [Anaerolineaceae bacterium]|nr:ADP-forming succinate--CoA ligase subunit beta [Anaerolineaceae bacterium]HQP08507.1 ADP-forming succinate--CoA ligase subunit beta [Anaerolineaceae bacterium]